VAVRKITLIFPPRPVDDLGCASFCRGGVPRGNLHLRAVQGVESADTMSELKTSRPLTMFFDDLDLAPGVIDAGAEALLRSGHCEIYAPETAASLATRVFLSMARGALL
jgi:hypothetical protein